MGISHRLTLGLRQDVQESATFIGTTRPVRNMVSALDWEYDETRRNRRLADALRRLKPAERAFVRRVLAGESWREIGISKQLFAYRLKKIEKIFQPHKYKAKSHFGAHSREKIFDRPPRN